MNLILQPEGWTKPKGYVNGVSARGQHVFVAGQVGWNARCEFETLEFAGQLRQALSNVIAILAEAQAGPEHVTSMTWFITDTLAYKRDLKAIGQVWRDIMGKNFPAMAVVQVAGLVDEGAQLEIQAHAVIPD